MATDLDGHQTELLDIIEFELKDLLLLFLTKLHKRGIYDDEQLVVASITR
jgi:hypothetical protein